MQYRAITADEVKDVARLMRLAFSDPIALTEHYAELLGIDKYRGLFDGDRMIACAAFFEDAHRFGCGSISAWGITCVGVDPGTRGRGVSGKLITKTLEEAAASGPAIATLYASAPAVYRKMGFERAGKAFAYKARIRPTGCRRAAQGTFRCGRPKGKRNPRSADAYPKPLAASNQRTLRAGRRNLEMLAAALRQADRRLCLAGRGR